MMYPCKQCLENSWQKQVIDGVVIATCNFCSFEVQFSARKDYGKPKKVKKKRKPENWKKALSKRKDWHDHRNHVPPSSYLIDV